MPSLRYTGWRERERDPRVDLGFYIEVDQPAVCFSVRSAERPPKNTYKVVLGKYLIFFAVPYRIVQWTLSLIYLLVILPRLNCTLLKRLATFPSSAAGMSLIKLSLSGIIQLFLPRESLVSDIPAGDGNVVNLFLRGTQVGTKLRRRVPYPV